jgi:hypothetical protein
MWKSYLDDLLSIEKYNALQFDDVVNKELCPSVRMSNCKETHPSRGGYLAVELS